MSERNTILLKGEPIQTEEYAALAANITPGMLVELDTNSKFIPHGTQGGPSARWFALERTEMNQDIDEEYAANDIVKIGSCHQGEEISALIPSGANIAIDTPLQSNGAGKLEARTGSNTIVARSRETVNNTAGPGDARLRVAIE